MIIEGNFSSLKELVIDNNLCVSCGTCIGVCPACVLQVSDVGEPVLVKACNNCGECVRFCPVLNFNFKEFRAYHITRKFDPFIGGYDDILFGETKDAEVWWKAAGGGVVSSMLISALKKGIISGAIVVQIDRNNNMRAKSFIARTREEILFAAQSKYIPTNVNSILTELKKENGVFALVGLPCQIQAIKMLQKNGPKWVSQKIKYVIGLYCGYTLKMSFVKYLLYRSGITEVDIKNIAFRVKLNRRTSALVIDTYTGRNIRLPKDLYNCLFYLFPKIGCLYCMDYTAEFSDISVGDMKPLSIGNLNPCKESLFQSVIIVRTENGIEFLRNDEEIEYHEYSLQDLIVSKLTNMVDRKICSHTRTNLRRAKGLSTPNYDPHIFDDYLVPAYSLMISPRKAYSLKRYLYEILWLEILKYSNNQIIIVILSRIPIGLLKWILRRTIIRYKARGFYTIV